MKIKGKATIVCTNSVRPQKGQHILVHSAELLREIGLDLEVIIVGENKRFYKPEHEKYHENLISLIDRANLKNNFNFVGSVTPYVAADILRNADIAVFPSGSESFGKSILEAIATGTPTIVSDDVPAYREFIKPNVNALTVERKPEEFAKAINFLANNEDLYFRLSRQGVKSTKSFTWKTVTQKLEEVYYGIISELGA